MPNENLRAAQSARKDEFYTQWVEIEKEVSAYLDFDPDVFKDKTILLPCDDPEWSNFTKFFAQNFERFGIKKLISTSYAVFAKPIDDGYEPTTFEIENPKFDKKKTKSNGKIFTLERDITGDGRIDISDLEWKYLEGDGDFKSSEITDIRDEADIIITNPPFSLFRDFLAWILEGGKDFSIIGNMNAVTYKEVFPLIQSNQVWYGPSISSGDREFGVPDSYPLNAAGFRVDDQGNKFIKVKGVRWFTNIEHGRRYEPLSLMTMKDNLKFNKQIQKCDESYKQYSNYAAIEVPYTNGIPSDHEGVMGVPISFLDKYCPEQFDILGITDRGNEWGLKTKDFKTDEVSNAGDLNRRAAIKIDDAYKATYARLLIKSKEVI